MFHPYCILPSLRYCSSPRNLGSHGAAAVLQAFRSVTPTIGVIARGCERACACVYPTVVETERSGAVSALFCYRHTLVSAFSAVYLCRHHTLLLQALAFDVAASMVQAAVAVLQSCMYKYMCYSKQLQASESRCTTRYRGSRCP